MPAAKNYTQVHTNPDGRKGFFRNLREEIDRFEEDETITRVVVIGLQSLGDDEDDGCNVHTTHNFGDELAMLFVLNRLSEICIKAAVETRSVTDIN